MDQDDVGAPTAERDEQLGALLDELLAAARSGRPAPLDDLIRRHPEYESELRELWATAMIADDFGSFASEHGLSPDGETFVLPGTPPRAPAAGWPRQVGDYELLDELGRGGMGVVFKARQVTLGRLVALKMILRGALASDVDVARFRAEAESSARLNHPHIVPVYEVGSYEGQPFFSMKYIEGTTLARRLAEGPLPARQAAELLVPVCRAIAEAHRCGVLHRDLKPSNILIDQDGRPYVTDFGLAKRFAPPIGMSAGPAADGSVPGLTHSGGIVGTPGYMAPEQAAGQRGEVGVATDIYSLGAILYAMLTGRPPFQAPSPVDTLLMVLEQDPLPPRLLNPKADSDLEMIALKCLQKPVDLRYATADELADDLEAYLADEPISARSSHFSQVLSRAFRESHHAAVLENWGLLWMWHSLALVVLCVVTNAFQWAGVVSRWPYVALWTVGLGWWAFIFWSLRRRSGPVSFVERQIAHVWAGSMAASCLLYAVEALLDMPVLALSPVLGLIAGMVFLVKAGILSGAFYIQAVVLFATALAMALLRESRWPDFSISLFGIVSGACFFVPGLKYYRQRARNGRNA